MMQKKRAAFILIMLWLPLTLFSASLTEKYPSYSYVFSEFGVDESYIYDSSFVTFATHNEKKLHKFYKRVIERGEVLLPLMRNHLIDNDLSDLLVYISMIESGLNTNIVSKKKAVGLWQFMPITAKYYKLEVCKGFDERCDPDSSTKAAMKYLGRLHKEFGQWYLAVMAYNCGEGRLRKAIKKAGSSDLSILLNPYEKYLPKETRAYIKKILLIAMIGENEILDFQSQSAGTMKVDVDAGTKLADIAKMLEMKLSVLKSYNRQYKNGRVPLKKKSYSLMIPEEKMVLFYMKYEPKVEEKVIKPHFISHYVLMGDTLDSLAKKYNTDAEEIKIANKLEDDFLTLDMFLLIPVTEDLFESLLNE